MPLHRGGCHCQAVTFEFDAPYALEVIGCNCSICSMSGFEHIIVSKKDFTLLSGQEDLISYSFNTGTARHLFCRHCGIKSFYQPRSHPDSYSLNLRCLKSGTFEIANRIMFDGQNWEDNIKDIQ